MDNFGFQTQGKNYNEFRPKYPSCLYEYTMNKIKYRSKYLDVAMGTGQLLFNIAGEFVSSRGIDISEKMLTTARQQLSSKYKQLEGKISIQKCDVMQLKDNQKYDLITVGQALHWLPVCQALLKLKCLLQPEGKLLVLSYVLKRIQESDQNQMYESFYNRVKPLFDFDRDQLHNHYSNKEKYPFDEVFSNVVRFSEQVKISMQRHAYVNYLRTYSGYNLYLLKNPNQPDPLAQIQKGEKDKVTLVFDFFKIQCGL